MTYHLFGAEQFAKMKSSAIFINAGRGPVVDENALIAALQKGEIHAAGLDVFEQEPLSVDSPLLSMANVVAGRRTRIWNMPPMRRVMAWPPVPWII